MTRSRGARWPRRARRSCASGHPRVAVFATLQGELCLLCRLVEQRVNAKEEKRAQAQARRRGEQSSNPSTPATEDDHCAVEAGTSRRAAAARTPRDVRCTEEATSGDGSQPRLQVLRCLEKLPPDVWLDVLLRLGPRELCICACVCTVLSALVATDQIWLALHLQFYACVPCNERAGAERRDANELDAPRTPPAHRPRAHAQPTHRRRLSESEKAMGEWRSPSQPLQLALPAMTSACLSNGLGVSTHGGGFLRVWEVDSGRRLACSRKQRHELTCCHAVQSYIATGDTGGLVHVFHTTETLDRYRIACLVASHAVSHRMPRRIASYRVVPYCLASRRGIICHASSWQVLSHADATPVVPCHGHRHASPASFNR